MKTKLLALAGVAAAAVAVYAAVKHGTPIGHAADVWWPRSPK
jgi:hypothetical protein